MWCSQCMTCFMSYMGIGTPISVVIAELTIQIFENKALLNTPCMSNTLLEALCRWHYVDDIITAIQNKEIEKFMNDLNSQNENIKFKAKIEENKYIPFLDLLLSHTDDGSMNFKVYRSMHVRMWILTCCESEIINLGIYIYYCFLKNFAYIFSSWRCTNVCTKRPIVYNINSKIIMNFRNLLFQQPYNIRKLVRNIEINEKKLIQAKMDVLFINTCINLYIYIYY